MTRRLAGWTLLDGLFLMMIITVVLIPMAGLFPMGHVAVQKGRTLAVCSSLANQAVSQVRANFPKGLVNAVADAQITSSTTTIDNVPYTITRQMWTVETRNFVQGTASHPVCFVLDVEVTISYPGGPPYVYATRVCQAVGDVEGQ